MKKVFRYMRSILQIMLHGLNKPPHFGLCHIVQKKKAAPIFGASGTTVVVYYIVAKGLPRLTLMQNSATADLVSTWAWQKILKRNGSWQVCLKETFL
jgi:hypothetical protein